MFSLFRKHPAPRVVHVPPTPRAANLDIPAYLRRTPAEQRAIDETWADARVAVQREKSSLNRGILSWR